MSWTATPYNNTTPYIRPFGDVAISVSASLLLTMMLFGIFANLVTMIVIVTSRKLANAFNFLIVSLCVSDLISALISPLLLYRRTWGFDDWLIPVFFCKVFWAFDTWTTYVTSLHIVLFAVFRLLSVQWPLGYRKIKLTHVKLMTAVMWFVTFGCGFIPRWLWYEATTKDRYSDAIDSKWPACTLNIEWLDEYRIYSKIAFSLFIYAPIGAVAVLSPVIAIILMKQRSKRLNRKERLENSQPTSISERKTQRKENYAILQLGFITGSFILGYVPITSYTFYTTGTKSTTLEGKIIDWNFGLTAYLLLRLSECLNPIFYNIASRKLRSETMCFLKSCCKCIKHSGGRPAPSSTTSAGDLTYNRNLEM